MQSSLINEHVGLLRDGLKRGKFAESPSLVSTISLPNMDSSLLAYNLKVSRAGCQGNSQELQSLICRYILA